MTFVVYFEEPVMYSFISYKGFYLELHKISNKYPHLSHKKWGMRKCHRLLGTELCHSTPSSYTEALNLSI